jgi:hypothetical protein
MDPAAKAAGIVRLIASTVAPESWYLRAEPRSTIEVVNGTRLVIHTNAEGHAQVSELLDALRRLGDVAVRIDARLYMVNREVYRKVRDSKRLTQAELEGLEKRGAEDEKGSRPERLLRKQKAVAVALEVTIANGQEGAILSQYKAVCIPPILRDRKAPELPGNSALTAPQTVLEGMTFAAGVTVSADRRFVRLKITEKGTEIDRLPQVELPKIKKPNDKDTVQDQVDELLDALRRAGPLEPVLTETAHTQETGIPDGGSRIIAIHLRPRSLREAKRWYVLVISPRIVIKEEERAFLEEALTASLPALLTDVLTNPRLKATRAFYGSPDDDRFALVPGERWSWPQQPAIAEHRLTPSAPGGKRLLGIRIDDFQWAGKDRSDLTITVTLLNAGGSDNGAVPGSGRLRYAARTKDKKWLIELSERP